MYTIFNRIKLTIWTICAFRVLNPHQWSWLEFIKLVIWLVCYAIWLRHSKQDFWIYISSFYYTSSGKGSLMKVRYARVTLSRFWLRYIIWNFQFCPKLFLDVMKKTMATRWLQKATRWHLNHMCTREIGMTRVFNETKEATRLLRVAIVVEFYQIQKNDSICMIRRER